MKNKNYLETDFLDIIFQGRNKAYGAYYIRKTYAKRVKKSLLTLILLLTVGLISVSFKPKPDVIPVKPEWTGPGEIIEIDLPKDAGKHLAGMIPKIPEPADAPPTEIAPKEDIPKEEPEDKVEPKDTEVPPIGDVNGSDNPTGPIGNDGTETGGGPIGDDGTSGDPGPTPATTPDPDPDPVPFVEQMPEFPGGLDALNSYLRDNINYPKLAKRIGTEGRVILEFVVDKYGNITSIKVARGIGAGCDQEAIRVVNGMPQWSPGVQNGKTVPVSYTLPMSFTLN